jgi:hypothetical protein
MKRIALVASFAASLVALAQDKQAAPTRLVVHEWGTFTSIYGADGTMLEWQPLIGDDLPDFVYSRRAVSAPVDYSNSKKVPSRQRMETPVLYFYPSREMTVDVAVGFPQGLITEWYPRVRSFTPALGDGRKPIPVAGGSVRWGPVRLLPDAKAELPRQGESKHYYHARETDSAVVRACAQEDHEKPEFEKYLFYRGVGDFDLPLEIRAHDGLRLSVRNPGRRDVPCLFAIHVNADKSGRYRALDALRAGDSRDIAIDGPTLPHDELVKRLGGELEEQLVKLGLYRKEAAAMVATWNDSYFETPGTRLLYPLPSTMTDEILPLTITPKPTEVTRVIVARVDILTPEQTESVVSTIRDLGDESFDVREAASKRIAAYGRFADPALREAIKTTTDLEVKTRAQALLDGMTPRR